MFLSPFFALSYFATSGGLLRYQGGRKISETCDSCSRAVAAERFNGKRMNQVRLIARNRTFASEYQFSDPPILDTENYAYAIHR